MKMGKVCNTNGCENLGRTFPDSERFCPSCGNELSAVANKAETMGIGGVMPLGTNMQQDNRIHQGDRTDIAGDSINAQCVDKRTMTSTTSNITTNNTTTNNQYVQNIVDETKKVTRCQLSGRTIPILEAVECRICHRTVAIQYYEESEFMCKECYKKKHPDAPKPEPKAAIPPLTGGPVRQEAVRVERIRTQLDEPKKKSRSWIWIAVVAAVIVAGAIFMMQNSSSDKQTVSVESAEPQAKELAGAKTGNEQSGAVKAKPQVTKETTVKAKPMKAETVAAKPKAVETESSETVKAEAAPVTGQSAYKAGNYAQAKILLEKELNGGDGSAAYTLSLMHKYGKGVTVNLRKAFTYMKQAAELECSDAYYELAEMYRTGDGTEPNRVRAKKWYEQAVATNAKNASKASEKLSLY